MVSLIIRNNDSHAAAVSQQLQNGIFNYQKQLNYYKFQKNYMIIDYSQIQSCLLIAEIPLIRRDFLFLIVFQRDNLSIKDVKISSQKQEMKFV